ncbi:hypothetical protein GLOIN_2v1722944 [Rhizophagus irregularis DAOM 181602=DAOM 197198]|nr:hypothetical protein GLOIN_2v1722944 [Rhizophagus irregularis DAOM 181602=DAOM 197198]
MSLYPPTSSRRSVESVTSPRTRHTSLPMITSTTSPSVGIISAPPKGTGSSTQLVAAHAVIFIARIVGWMI